MRFTIHAIVAALIAAASGCAERSKPEPRPAPVEGGPADRWAALRARMVEEQLAARDITDARVLAAMRAVPRHAFVPSPSDDAYGDHPLSIGHDQTISQPYIVALMTQLAAVGPRSKVLEIGTGSGYQAAVLAELTPHVYSIEIVEPLGERAAETLAGLGYRVNLRIGDGYRGWPEAAPFDAILVTAAPPEIPAPLKEQLQVGGRLVLPVGGDGHQELRVITRTAAGYDERRVTAVRFVPMTGEAQEAR